MYLRKTSEDMAFPTKDTSNDAVAPPKGASSISWQDPREVWATIVVRGLCDLPFRFWGIRLKIWDGSSNLIIIDDIAPKPSTL